MKAIKRGPILGWTAVGISIVITCLWAFWGITENFHEGWYFESLASNLGLMLVQYLGPMLLFMGAALLAVRWPRFGGGLHLVLALLAAWFFRAFSNAATFLIILPLIGLGALYWVGRLEQRRTAASLIVGLPVLTLILAGIGPAVRVSQRIDDRNLDARTVHGNGVILTWAPDGPGWPRAGGSWYEAMRACQYLEQDGEAIAPAPQNTWRLPSVDETVRSMSRHGQDSGGTWDAPTAKAKYITAPDKESPLWNVHSQVIYWWTATEIGDERAYIIAYDGKVWPRAKQISPPYVGFRCVR